MAEEWDPESWEKWKYALSQWADGGMYFLPRPAAWIRGNFGGHVSPWDIAQAMHEWVEAGNRVKRIKENGDPDVYQNEFHDDLVFPYRKRILYAETVFTEKRDRDDCRIDVVNIKDHKR